MNLTKCPEILDTALWPPPGSVVDTRTSGAGVKFYKV